MNEYKSLPEFRFYYFTNRYPETVDFYKNVLQLEMMRSWDREDGDKGTIFYSPNGTGLIEIEEGNESPIIQGALYIQVEDVDGWYQKVVAGNAKIVQPIMDTSYGHRNFKFDDPGGLTIGMFRYNK